LFVTPSSSSATTSKKKAVAVAQQQRQEKQRPAPAPGKQLVAIAKDGEDEVSRKQKLIKKIKNHFPLKT
jgi:hypothetical protein